MRVLSVTSLPSLTKASHVCTPKELLKGGLSPGGLYETLTGAGTGNIPAVTVDSTAIEGYSVAHKGENYTVTLSINNVVATLDGALDFVGPQITTAADGLISNTVGTVSNANDLDETGCSATCKVVDSASFRL